jgi:hypothetical protein
MARENVCLPIVIMLKAGAFLAVSAYLLAQLDLFLSDIEPAAWIMNMLKSFVGIFCPKCVQEPGRHGFHHALGSVHTFFVVMVILCALEAALALVALVYTIFTCHPLTDCSSGIWMAITLLQIPSFLMLCTFACLATIGAFVASSNVAVIMLFCFAFPSLLLGCVSCCGSCRRCCCPHTSHGGGDNHYLLLQQQQQQHVIQTHTNIVVGDGTIQGVQGSTDGSGGVGQRPTGDIATSTIRTPVANIPDGTRDGTRDGRALFCGFCGSRRVDKPDQAVVRCVSCGRKLKGDDEKSE